MLAVFFLGAGSAMIAAEFAYSLELGLGRIRSQNNVSGNIEFGVRVLVGCAQLRSTGQHAVAVSV